MPLIQVQDWCSLSGSAGGVPEGTEMCALNSGLGIR